jgi:3',5'-cyclic AMP phosphodiesterase CpdA
MTFRLAHLTDPHLPLPKARFRDLLGKRVLGWQSWHRSRRRTHLPAVLAAVLRDLESHSPDRIAVTGDIGNIALPGEIAAARAWLEALGPPERVMAVPGNHDAYVRIGPHEAMASWAPFVAGDAGDTQPAVRRVGEIALIGVNTGWPMPWWSSQGRVGAKQLAALEARLAELGREGACRVVLIHHPPLAIRGGRGRKGLIDAAGFRDVVARAGAELVIHGHTHRRHLGKIESAAGATPVIGAPSASAGDARHGDLGGWNLYEISRAAGGWHINVTCRATDPTGRGLTVSHFGLTVSP